MANSGTFNNCTWSSGNPYNTTYQIPYINIENFTQSIENNTTSITFSFRIYRNASGSVTYKNTAPYKSQINNGNSSSGITSFRITNIGVGSNMEIFRRTFSIAHNADGTCNPISIYAQLDLSGTTEGVNSATRKYTPKTIPRTSSFSCESSWQIASSAFTINISSSSPSFTHNVRILTAQNGTVLASVNLGTGISKATFNTTDFYYNCFSHLAQSENKSAYVEVITLNGNTQIGSAGKSIDLKAPPSTQPTCTDFFIGDQMAIGINRSNNGFVHKLSVTFGTKTILSRDNVETSYSFTPASSDLYSQIPNTISGTGTINCTTFYKNGSSSVQVQKIKNCTFTAKVKESLNLPQIGPCTYSDTNPVTVAVTGNSAYIVRNESKLTIQVGACTAKNYASVSEVKVSLNGSEKVNKGGAAHSQSFNEIDVETDLKAIITVKDSRGITTSDELPIKILDYTSPIILNASAKRKNGYEDITYISATLKISDVIINGMNKNHITESYYKVKKISNQDYETAQPFVSDQIYTIELNKLYSYNICFDLKDSFGNTYEKVMEIPQGRPVLFLDQNANVGISGFTKKGYALNVEGDVCINGNLDVKDFVNLIYPIGSIYMSVSSTNPNKLFGGTWEKWGSGRVPVGIDSSQTEFAASELHGGSKSQNLTVDQLPSHLHSMSHTHTTPSSYDSYNGNHTHTTQAKTIVNPIIVSGTTLGWTHNYFDKTKITRDGVGPRADENLNLNIPALTMTTVGEHRHIIPAMTTNSISTTNTGYTGSANAHNNLQPYITCYMWKRIA